MATNEIESAAFIDRDKVNCLRELPGVQCEELAVNSCLSTNHRGRMWSHVFLRSKVTPQCKKALILACIAICVIIVIIIVTTLLLQRDNSTPSNPTDSQPGQNTTALFHPGCTDLDFKNGSTERDWKKHNSNSEDWNSVKRFVPDQIRDYISSIIVSPLFKIFNNSCSIQISLNFGSTSSFDVYIVTSFEYYNVSMTSDNCTYGYLDNQTILSTISSFHVVITSQSNLDSKGASASVTSHRCVAFKSIATSEVMTTSAKFSKVMLGSRDLCSSEIFNQSIIECNWWNVVALGNANFTRIENHACIVRGVTYEVNDGLGWFLYLNGTHNDTRGFLISPILEGGASHLLLSLWHIFQCGGSSLKVFLIASSRDVTVVTSDIVPDYKIKVSTPSSKWVFKKSEIKIPPSYKSFQVVIEGVVTSLANCTNHKCHNEGSKETDVQTPSLAIDDIVLEVKFNQCEPTSKQLAIIDCTFQDSNNQSSICEWSSSTPSDDPLTAIYFAHWQSGNTPENENILEGRGHILSFDANGNSGTSPYFRSPLLMANSNCSCTMSFLYLLSGEWAPRLNVNIILGGDLFSDNRPVLPQFSVFGHQDENWVLQTILLNIQSRIPFQIEIRVLDLSDTRGDVHMDDFKFQNCDFRLT